MRLLVAATSLGALLGAGGIARAAGDDPPRWRMQASLTQGFGGSRDAGSTVAVFPTRLDFTGRIWGPLSISASATGVVMGFVDDACGTARRPSSALGTIGLRTDFSNSKNAGWLAPFFEVHASVGGQAIIRPPGAIGACTATQVFASGGARVGVDVWLGKVAVTVAGAFDYLPVASPLSISIGASFVLF